MRYGSVCSGIESASVAWEPLGFTPAWFAEVEAFPSAVLAHHWPRVANLGDMTALPALIRAGLIEAPDVLVGGTPCQAFSVAGMRKGLDDDRGQLTIKYVEVANAIDEKREAGSECIAVWENVPGVLSSKDNAFGCFLAALVGENDPLEPAGKKWTNAGIVYGPQRVAAWRVLDAQYFGVAQRRRRVFVVASARDEFSPASVLFEFEGLRRDTPPSREAGEETTSDAGGGFNECSGEPVYVTSPDGSAKKSRISPTLDARAEDGPRRNQGGTIVMAHGQGGAEVRKDGKSPTLTCNHESPIVCHGSQDPCVSDKAFALGRNGGRENVVCGTQNDACRDAAEEIAPTLRAGNNGGAVTPVVALPIHDKHAVAAFSAGQSKGAGSIAYQKEQSPTLRGGASGTNQVPTLHADTQVRRLTPRECERLQGFPDDHTLIPWRKKPAEDCPDGPRYKAIGNSKVVPVVRWLGDRLRRHVSGEL